MIAPLSASSSALAQQPARSDGDSDSDWDDDDDFVAKKINIKIKPIAQMTPGKISASMDELRATVGTWKSMNNINLVKPNSRRSQHLQYQPPNLANATNTTLAPPAPLPPLALPKLMVHPPLQTITSNTIESQQDHHHHHHHHHHDNHLLPIALAVQECLNVRTLLGPNGASTTSLIGHVRMAVPRKIIEMNATRFENNNLIFDISTSRAWSESHFNELLIGNSLQPPLQAGLEYATMNNNVANEHLNGGDNFAYQPFNRVPSSSSDIVDMNQNKTNTKRVAVDMLAVYKYCKDLYQRQPKSSYFLLPELLNYKITRSLKQQRANLPAGGDSCTHLLDHEDQPIPCLNPVEPVAHWLCDLSVTKVRIDLDCLEDRLSFCGLMPSDVKNIKISLKVNGGVESQQSKPPATWSTIDSKLTWSFTDLAELIQSSTFNGVTSCLAKFNLNDGPSTPDDMEVQFAIQGKTLSGTQVVLASGSNEDANGDSYLITKRKFEVRTGRFRCEPAHKCPPTLVM